MMTPGKLDVIIKFNRAPDVRETTKAGTTFDVMCGSRVVSVTLRHKMWKKVVEAKTKGGVFALAIAGRMGAPTPGGGFVLDDPSLQVCDVRLPRRLRHRPKEGSSS